MERQIASKQANCDQIQAQLDNFRDQLAKIETNYGALLDEIAGLEALINQNKDAVASLRDGISGIPNELKLLRAEHSRVDAALGRQFYLCDATAD